MTNQNNINHLLDQSMNHSLTSKTILVTGAGGFIGSHLVEALLMHGTQVRAFIRYNSRHDIGLLNQLPEGLRSQVEIIAGDLRDAGALRKAMHGCQVVFHLGALISIPYSYLHPAEVAEVNFMGTLNILQNCLDLGIERLVHTSTSEVYGTAIQVPIPESHSLQGQSPYSASKIGADKLVESFHCSYDLPVVTVRPFNTYGPRQSTRAVIPTIISQALVRDEISLGNLQALRDFTYVSDTVQGFLKAAEAEKAVGGTFNLGSGLEISIGELVEKIIQLIGRQVRLHQDTARLRPERSEVGRLLSDNTLARQVLDWSPTISLDEGLTLTIDWIREHPDLYRVDRYEI
jgi:NAD dependent epimerase/dehydratase